jgi:hypothetical protein
MLMMSLPAYQHCFFVLHGAVSKIGYGDLVMDGLWAI